MLNNRFDLLLENSEQQVNQTLTLFSRYCSLSCHALTGSLVFWLHLHSCYKLTEAVVPLRPSSPVWWEADISICALWRSTNPWQLCPSGTISVALLVVWYNGFPSFVLEIVLISPTAGVGVANIRVTQWDWQNHRSMILQARCLHG